MSEKVSNLYLNMLVSHLRRQSNNTLFSKVGLPEYEQNPVDKTGSIEIEKLLDIAFSLEEVLNNRLFSAEAGSYAHPGDYGILGYILMSCRDYQQVIDIAYRYQHLINDCLYRCPSREDDTVVSTLSDVGYDAEYIRPYVEMEFASLVAMSHFLTGSVFVNHNVPITLHFRHAAAGDLVRYSEIFRTPLLFSDTDNKITMHEAVLSAPVYACDERLLNIMIGEIQGVRTSNQKEQEFANKVAAYIKANVVHSIPKLEECAQAFDISASTLKRRLASSGVSYQDIIDQVRFGIAKKLLEENMLSHIEISCVLGFSKVYAFTRAFKRWTDGMTPTEYKQQFR